MNKDYSSPTTFDYPQHSLFKSFLLSILPGILVTIAFIVLKPLFNSSGYPPLLAFLLAVMFVDMPVMLGVMLYEGKKLNGGYSLDGVVLYREKVGWKTFSLIFIGAFVVLYLVISLLTPIGDALSGSVFAWLPDWMFLEQPTQYEAYSKTVLLVAFTLQLVITGMALPWVEELYFRGYLLPRISRFGILAPIFGGLFFGLYHIWTPYSFLTVLLLGVALSYVVWWKRDIRLSISLHVVANTLVRLMLLMAALAM